MRKNYINGDWVDALSDQTKPLINPASEEKIADLPFGNADDYRLAISAAIRSWDSWQSKSPYYRAEILKTDFDTHKLWLFGAGLCYELIHMETMVSNG